MPTERLLTVRQVAERLGVSTSTVYKLCGAGKLPHVRVSNAIRVAPGALQGVLRGATHSNDAYSAGPRPR